MPMSSFVKHMALDALQGQFQLLTCNGSRLLIVHEKTGTLTGCMWFMKWNDSPMKNEGSKATIHLNQRSLGLLLLARFHL